MKRSRFLASLAALAVAPFVRLDAPKPPIPPAMPKFNQIGEWTPQKVLQFYNETGVLIYARDIDRTEDRFMMEMEIGLLSSDGKV